MQLRNDFKYALIEEYKTYWNAYDNPNEFYSDILSMSNEMFEHFTARRMSAKGMSAVREFVDFYFVAMDAIVPAVGYVPMLAEQKMASLMSWSAFSRG